MNKIYIFKSGQLQNDVIGMALSEDGYELASHLSSNIDFLKHDMGLTSKWKHDTYKEHYPDGYELVWVEDWKTDPRIQAITEMVKNETPRPTLHL